MVSSCWDVLWNLLVAMFVRLWEIWNYEYRLVFERKRCKPVLFSACWHFFSQISHLHWLSLSIWTATEKQTGGLKQITSSVRLNRNQPWEREFVSFYVAKILSRYKIIFKWEEELRRNKEFIKSTHFKYYCLSQVEEKEPPNDKLRDFPKKNISYGEELWKVR